MAIAAANRCILPPRTNNDVILGLAQLSGALASPGADVAERPCRPSQRLSGGPQERNTLLFFRGSVGHGSRDVASITRPPSGLRSDRWQAGESMSSIADEVRSGVLVGVLRDLADRRHSTACPPAAAARLGPGEREEISRGLSAHCSLRRIAHQLGRAPSTISREIRRNGGPAGYRATRSISSSGSPCGLGPASCCRPLLGSDSIWQAAAQMVARADRRLAQARLPRGAPEPGVPRNDLPQPVHPGPRRAEEGTP